MRFKLKPKTKTKSKFPIHIKGSVTHRDYNGERLIRKFLLFPRCVDREFRWLETVYWLESYPVVDYVNYDEFHFWRRCGGFIKESDIDSIVEEREGFFKMLELD